MFCRNCGTDLGGGTKFCPECGCSTSAAAVPAWPTSVGYLVYQPAPIYTKELEELEKAIAHFAQKKSVYEEYGRTVSEIMRIVLSRDKSTYVLGTVIVALFGGGALVLALLGVIQLLLLKDSSLLVGGVVMFTFMIPGIWLRVQFRRADKPRIKNLLQQVERYNQLTTELYNHYRTYQFCPISHEYTNPVILNEIKNVMLSGRAYTVNDALYLMLEDARISGRKNYAKEAFQQASQLSKSAMFSVYFITTDYFKRRLTAA